MEGPWSALGAHHRATTGAELAARAAGLARPRMSVGLAGGTRRQRGEVEVPGRLIGHAEQPVPREPPGVVRAHPGDRRDRPVLPEGLVAGERKGVAPEVGEVEPRGRRVGSRLRRHLVGRDGGKVTVRAERLVVGMDVPAGIPPQAGAVAPPAAGGDRAAVPEIVVSRVAGSNDRQMCEAADRSRVVPPRGRGEVGRKIDGQAPPPPVPQGTRAAASVPRGRRTRGFRTTSPRLSWTGRPGIRCARCPRASRSSWDATLPPLRASCRTIPRWHWPMPGRRPGVLGVSLSSARRLG